MLGGGDRWLTADAADAVEAADAQNLRVRLEQLAADAARDEHDMVRRTVAFVFRQGARLVEAQVVHARLKLLDATLPDWTETITTRFGLSIRAAQYYQRVYRTFGTHRPEALLRYIPDLTSWYALASPSTPDSARAEILDRAERQMETRLKDVRAIIAAHVETMALASATQALLDYAGDASAVPISELRSMSEVAAAAADGAYPELDGEQHYISSLFADVTGAATLTRRAQHIEATYALNVTAAGRVLRNRRGRIYLELLDATSNLDAWHGQVVDVVVRVRRPAADNKKAPTLSGRG